MSRTASQELLLHCLREEPDASELERLTFSDWHDLMQAARSHAVLYLLYHRLKKQNFDSLIPTDILQTLRTGYFELAWRTNSLYNDLAKILKALQQKNIPVIPLKGTYLAQTVYSNIALRPMADIDILVKKNDLLKAREQLLGLGYSPSREIDIEIVQTYSQHLPPMVKQDSPPVELHWTLEAPTTPFTIDIEGLWRRAQPIFIAGADALTLSPEDLLLHLCLHTSAHHLYSNGLQAFCDIRETIRHYRDELNWEILQNRASEWGAGNAVYLTLSLAKSLLDADVPDALLDRLKPEKETRLPLADAEQLIFNGSDWRKITPQQARNLFASESALKTATLFLQRIFLPRETMARLYALPPNSPRIPLYYPVRLKDLLVRHSRTVWRIWSRDKATVRQWEHSQKVGMFFFLTAALFLQDIRINSWHQRGLCPQPN